MSARTDLKGLGVQDMNTDEPSNKNQDEAQPCDPVGADHDRPLGGGAVGGGGIGGTAGEDESEDWGRQIPGRNPQKGQPGGGHTGQQGGGQGGQQGSGSSQGGQRGGGLVDPPENADLGGDEDTPAW